MENYLMTKITVSYCFELTANNSTYMVLISIYPLDYSSGHRYLIAGKLIHPLQAQTSWKVIRKKLLTRDYHLPSSTNTNININPFSGLVSI